MVWKKMFKPHILERGQDYYESGFVQEYYEGVNFVQVTVRGSSDYDVHIDIVDEEIQYMECTCPYAQDGNYCKHMAAVLFYMENEVEAGSEDHKKKDKETACIIETCSESNIKELIQKADETVVRDFLTNILERDEKLLGRFKSTICCEISLKDMQQYKNQIKHIFSKYSGRQGFIDYYIVGNFIYELQDFLDNDVVIMLKKCQYKEAFELTCYLFVKIGNQDMDDSDGGTGMIIERCMEIWSEIYDKSNIDLKRSMYRWFKNHLDGSVIDFMEENIEQLLFDNFIENEFLTDKLEFIEGKVCECLKESESWLRGYHTGKWIIRYIDVMKELRMPEKSIEEYAKEYLEFSIVRKYYIQDCITKKKYDVAIQVLEDGKLVDKSAVGLVVDYSMKLKELYKQTGRAEDYEKELWLLMLQYKPGNVDVYKELKTLYEESDWIQKRELIFKKLPPYAAVDKLYKEEALYDRLLKVVLNSNGLDKLTEYESCLKKKYPEELLGKYESVIGEMVSYSSDRKRYRELVAILKRMQKYPGGKKRVDEIVSSWRYRFKNRPAMMDELNKL